MGGNYRKGARFENRVKKHLEQNGWYVMRSAGSHGLADLHAMNPGSIWLIACRTDRARYSALEAHKLWQLARQLAQLGNRVTAHLAYRDPVPPWTLHIDRIKQEVWDPAKDELPPWADFEAYMTGTFPPEEKKHGA